MKIIEFTKIVPFVNSIRATPLSFSSATNYSIFSRCLFPFYGLYISFAGLFRPLRSAIFFCGLFSFFRLIISSANLFPYIRLRILFTNFFSFIRITICLRVLFYAYLTMISITVLIPLMLVKSFNRFCLATSAASFLFNHLAPFKRKIKPLIVSVRRMPIASSDLDNEGLETIITL